MSDDCSACRRRERRRELRRASVEPEDVAQAAQRLVAALGRRAAGDPGALPLLAALSREVDASLHAAVAVGIGKGWHSYGDVGRALGVTRQAAQKRFSKGRDDNEEDVA